MTRAAVYGSPAWRRWKHDHHWATDPLGEGNTALISALGGNAAVLGFYDARKNVTVSGSTVTQIDDVRGAVGFGPSLIGTGHAPTWDPVGLTASNTANTMYLQTAASALFDLSGPMTVINVMSVAPTSNDFTATISGSANAHVLGHAGSSAQTLRAIKSSGSAQLLGVGAGPSIRVMFAIASASAFAGACGNAAVQRTVENALTAVGNNSFTVFGSLGPSTDTGCVWRSSIIVAGDLGVGTGTTYTAAMNAVAKWAHAEHAAVLA